MSTLHVHHFAVDDDRRAVETTPFRHRQAITRLHVELPAVKRTHNDSVIELAGAQRSPLVGAHIRRGRNPAAFVEENPRLIAGLDTLHAADRNLGARCDE